MTLRLFAAARSEAGTSRDDFVAGTVRQLLDAAAARYGPSWAHVAEHSRVWLNGEPVDDAWALSRGDEVAVLPPVSGGAA